MPRVGSAMYIRDVSGRGMFTETFWSRILDHGPRLSTVSKLGE